MNVDRVEWRVIPDPATAAERADRRARSIGWNCRQPDLIPMLTRRIGRDHGTAGYLRHRGDPAAEQPDRADQQCRRCAGDDGRDRSDGSDDRGDGRGAGYRWRAPMGFFLPGMPRPPTTPAWSSARKRWTIDEVKAMLDKAGYGGERIVLLHPTDQLIYHAFHHRGRRCVPQGRDEHRRADGRLGHGRATPHQQGDGGQRRLVDVSRRRAGARSSSIRCWRTRCAATAPKAWFGWPDDPKLEAAYEAWIDAPRRCRTAQAGGRVPGGGVRLRADDPARTVPAAGGVAIECDRLLKGSAPVFWGVDKG